MFRDPPPECEGCRSITKGKKMLSSDFFSNEQVIGKFHGFQRCGMEFHANVVFFDREEFQSMPLYGQFLLIQLDIPSEALLGRIVSLQPVGTLASRAFEDYQLPSSRKRQRFLNVPWQDELKYRGNILILGVLKSSKDGDLLFVPSHRRQPRCNSLIAFPTGEVLQEIAGHNIDGAVIGHFALGEFIYAEGGTIMESKDWMEVLSPEVLIRFPVSNLIARRSLVFARAGFGKSNFNKLLFSELYKQNPTVTKRYDKKVPVGTLIFDPDGEYFWPDDKGRPGLCDVPELQDKLVVFTAREGPSPFYSSFVANGIRLDIRKLSPTVVLSTALSFQKQEQQNVLKLKALDPQRWKGLVELIDKSGNRAPLQKIRAFLDLEKGQESEALAARSNMTAVVQTLHDDESHLLEMLMMALSEGKLCVVDISLLHSSASLILSGLLLRLIFDHNQAEYTKVKSASIPTIAVIEEAQSVLTEKSPAANAYRDWVKEGRKYDLGSFLITQQPGSIPNEILSQSDNWFALHLLSATDLRTLQKANAYFSQDILRMLLNEPIPGHCSFWTSVGGKPYPISTRILSFEHKYRMLDPGYNKQMASTFVQRLRSKILAPVQQGQEAVLEPILA